MKRLTYIMLGIVLMVGVLFGTTRLEYMGEVKQLEFLVQQNQNLGVHNVKEARAASEKIAKLEEKIEMLKLEIDILRSESDDFDTALLSNLLVLEENLRLAKADIAMLTLYVEMLNKMLMEHLSPPPVVPFEKDNKEYNI